MPSRSVPMEQKLLSLVATVFDAYSVVLFLPDAHDGEEPETSRLTSYFSLGDRVIPDVRLAPGQGLVGWILRSRQPLIVSNFDGNRSNLDYYAGGEAGSIKAFMGCPLPMGGALCVDSKRQHSFTEKDNKILQMFAQLVGGMVHMRDVESAAAAIPNYFMQIGVIDDLRYRHRSWGPYISAFLQCVAQATGFDYCSFASVIVSGESYGIEAENHPVLTRGEGPMFQSMTNGGLVGWVLRNGQPVVQTGEQDRAPALYGSSRDLPTFAAVVCLPVTVSRSVRGAICLGHSMPMHVDEAMRTFLNQAVGHLALHLENLLLRSRLRDSMERTPSSRQAQRGEETSAQRIGE